MNDLSLNINNIYLNFKKKYENINIKNINIKIFEFLKIKTYIGTKILSTICEIKKINEKKFLLNFNDKNLLSEIIKNNILEKYGFQCIKKNLGLEIIIPNLSYEFRTQFINLIKDDYLSCIFNLENIRKTEILVFKNKNSKQEQYKLEKGLNKIISNYKEKLKETKNDFLNRILNE